MKRHEILITRGAARDLDEIYEYVRSADSETQADRLLDKLEVLIRSLAQNPDRGSRPKELSALGMREFRQVIHPPYRVFYRLIGPKVLVLIVADGRRDMTTLLAHRLLGSI